MPHLSAPQFARAAHPDLRALADARGPFVTVTLSAAPTRTEDSPHRFDAAWGQACRALDASVATALGPVVADLAHRHGNTFVVAHAVDGPTVVEALPNRLPTSVSIGPVPHLVDVLDARQRATTDDVIEHLRTRLPVGRATAVDGEVLDALLDGRVETLLVRSDRRHAPVSRSYAVTRGLALNASVVDTAIALALRTDATVRIRATTASEAPFDGSVAAVLRW